MAARQDKSGNETRSNLCTTLLNSTADGCLYVQCFFNLRCHDKSRLRPSPGGWATYGAGMQTAVLPGLGGRLYVVPITLSTKVKAGEAVPRMDGGPGSGRHIVREA